MVSGGKDACGKFFMVSGLAEFWRRSSINQLTLAKTRVTNCHPSRPEQPRAFAQVSDFNDSENYVLP